MRSAHPVNVYKFRALSIMKLEGGWDLVDFINFLTNISLKSNCTVASQLEPKIMRQVMRSLLSKKEHQTGILCTKNTQLKMTQNEP